MSNMTATDFDKLSGITNGTQAAGKCVVADANGNTGISKITELHIGASGGETQVTATAAQINNAIKVYLNVSMPDISTAKSVWVVSPIAGTFTKLYSIINGTIATADCAITTEIGGTPVTNGGLTIAYDGSAAGDVDSATPTAANTVSAGNALEIISDGASENAVDATFTLEITPS